MLKKVFSFTTQIPEILPWCIISSSFQNSLKTSGHRGYEFLEFWLLELAAAEFVVVFDVFFV